MKLFLRISHPRNSELNYKIKDRDPIAPDYVNSPFYLILHRSPKYYGEWKRLRKEKKSKAKKIHDEMEEEMDMIKRYLDEEDNFIKHDTDKEQKITDDLVKKLIEEKEKEYEDENDPLVEQTDILTREINEIEDLKKRGKEAEDKTDVLDDLPGKKKGVKITMNNVFDLKSKNPLKIKIDVFMEGKKLFDEFGNPCDYLLPEVDEHCDDSLFISAAALKKKRKKIKRIDVEVDEIQYVVKDLVGYLKYF